jgi:hypothetical protein
MIDVVLDVGTPWAVEGGTIVVRRIMPNKELDRLRHGVLAILAERKITWQTDKPWEPHVSCGTTMIVGGPTVCEVQLSNITLIGGPVIQSYEFNF